MRRTMVTVWSAIGLGLLAASAPALGADAAAGKALFREQCSICHSAEPGDNGGAQGPSLIGVYGRQAAGAQGFSYTEALRAANLTWDTATLSQFLASPTTVVPGSAMVIAVSNEPDRENLIAYFQDLGRTQSTAETASKAGATAGVSGIPVPAASALSADWRLDAPGRLHRIDLASLPPPFATPSAGNSPNVIARPAAAALALPPGFHRDLCYPSQESSQDAGGRQRRHFCQRDE